MSKTMGRELQKHFHQPQQCVITMPLLEGLDGVNKMSKSAGNYIGITESPGEMFGKLMSTSDELMWRYIELLSFEPVSVMRQWREEVKQGRNPRVQYQPVERPSHSLESMGTKIRV